MNWRRQLLHLLYPNRCPGCDALLTAEELVCGPCGESMLLEHDAICHICGKTRCVCKRQQFHYDRVAAACKYEHGTESARAVIQMKETRNANFGLFAARILAERIQWSLNYDTFDCTMPVPMHPSKLRKRGYNQAALIAKELARLLDIPYREDVLYKSSAGRTQHSLGARERAENVSSFGIRDIPLDGMRILLCDDVLTTGATMNRCAALLHENGASAVVAAAASVTVLRQETGT